VRDLRSDSGFTLVELLIAATLMIVVISATLTGLDSFGATTTSNSARNDAQEQARVAMDQLARELRNGATSSGQSPIGISTASSYELVFQTVDATKPAGSSNANNVMRVRYCLDTTDPTDGHLWTQAQRWTTATPPAVPSTTACPDAAWGNQRLVVRGVVNRNGGKDRPLFVPDSATPAQVTRLGLRLYLNARRGLATGQAEALLASAVALRNTNQQPTAVFTATVRANGHVALNATGSSDPEGEPLVYEWFDGSTRLPATTANYDYDPAGSGNHVLKLNVYDPSGVFGSATKAVSVP
jgi:type II secretory pathway pseudopilin PulG